MRRLSSREMPSAGSAISAEAPPDRSTSSRSRSPAAAATVSDRLGGRHAAVVRNGMCRDVPLHAGRKVSGGLVRDAERHDGTRHAARRAAGASSIGSAALPTATTSMAAADRTARTTSGVCRARRARVHRRRRPRAPRARRPSDRCEGREAFSVNLSGVGPGGEAGHGVELLEEAADDLVGVSVSAQCDRAGPSRGSAPFPPR